jgi:hypothetical protein
MPRITLSADEVAPGVLPPVCMACGAPAAVRVPVGFSWVPAWSYLLLVAGIWPWVLFYLLLRRAMAIDAPVCGRHRRHWVWRKMLLPAGLLVSLCILVAPAAADPNAPLPMWAFVGSSATFAATLGAAVWLRQAGVRAVTITREVVTLAGVAPEFVAAVEAGRADYTRREREWLERYDRAAGPG